MGGKDALLSLDCFPVENGIVLFLWIGLHVSPDWLQQVCGATTIGHVDIEMVRLVKVP